VRYRVAFLVVIATACSGPSRSEPLPPTPVVVDAGPDASTLARIDTPGDAAVDAAESNPCDTFDWKNPACHEYPRVCYGPGVRCKCPDPPDVENPGCWYVMACPKVPDRRVRACASAFPCPDPPDPSNPNCAPPMVIARVIKVEIVGSDTIVSIGTGTKAGVTKHWKAALLRGATDELLRGGEIEIVRVEPHVTIGRVRGVTSVVPPNVRVKLWP
jgi:hypothetical protein